VARGATVKPFDKAIQIAHFGSCAKDNGVRLTGGNVTLDRRPTVHYPVQQQLPFGTQRRVEMGHLLDVSWEHRVVVGGQGPHDLYLSESSSVVRACRSVTGSG
jgi:hypothetical protein